MSLGNGGKNRARWDQRAPVQTTLGDDGLTAGLFNLRLGGLGELGSRDLEGAGDFTVAEDLDRLFAGADETSGREALGGNFFNGGIEAAKVTAATPNAGKVTLSIDKGKVGNFVPGTSGSFKGSFELTDSDTSVTPNKNLVCKADFQGMIVDDGTELKGYGFFLLSKMPTASPKTTLATSPKLSGSDGKGRTFSVTALDRIDDSFVLVVATGDPGRRLVAQDRQAGSKRQLVH